MFIDSKKKAFTLSYDDGVVHDRRFIELLNKYGIKCTFNLNSECFDENTIFIGKDEKPIEENVHKTISAKEVLDLYAGHEIASHSCTHPKMVGMSCDDVKREVLQDIDNLKKLGNREDIRGFAYPYGAYDNTLEEYLKECGIVYARTVCDTYDFSIPDNFLEWRPTIHHKKAELLDLAHKFINSDEDDELFYVWGHSYEIYEENDWDRMEELFRLLKKHEDKIWFATNIEIYDFLVKGTNA